MSAPSEAPVTAPSRATANPPRPTRPNRPGVARALGIAQSATAQLKLALVLAAERHERDYEIAQTSTVLAGWIQADHDSLARFIERYGVVGSDQPQKVRAALLGGVRTGAGGLIADLTDLSLLAEQAKVSWTVLVQGAKELHDADLQTAAAAAREHAQRTIAWLRTQIKHTAPEALAVRPDIGDETAASIPRGMDRLASIPDPIWGPLASGALIAVVGAVGLLVGRPWLLPSLGPSAFLAAEMPAHPVTRPWNTVVGHAGGLLAGFAGVLLAGAAGSPSVLGDHVLVAPRVLAAIIAIALTAILGAILAASHPPAAATTLLVALGSIKTLEDSINLMAGVVVIAIAGELFREARTRRVAPAERLAPRESLVRRYLRPGA
jgi:hypothetical protein